ncbi:hypothetical protein RJT34_03923 [Clitoria ternatea]|uniref:Transmembrane protein n=1 Tax=Clitoria ternatea TaxID=43366 RepID=A0AAN9Q061_CLITE
MDGGGVVNGPSSKQVVRRREVRFGNCFEQRKPQVRSQPQVWTFPFLFFLSLFLSIVWIAVIPLSLCIHHVSFLSQTLLQ